MHDGFKKTKKQSKFAAVCFIALHLSSLLSTASEGGHAHNLSRETGPPATSTSTAPFDDSQYKLMHFRDSDRDMNAKSIAAYRDGATARTAPARLGLFSLERSGAAWLVAMLNSNRGVKIVNEPMLALSGKRAPASKEMDALRASMTALEVKAREAHPPLRLVGFGEKLLPGRYSLASDFEALHQLREFLVENQFKVVLLLRKNIVFQAVSMLRAARLSADPRCGEQAWSRDRGAAWEEACGGTARRVWAEAVNVTQLRAALDGLRAKAKAVLTILSTFKMPRLTVYYEDMLKAPNRTLRLISFWSGLRASDMLLQPLPTPSLRDNAGERPFALLSSNSTNIRNYQEIRKFLSQYNPCMLRTMEADASGETDLTLCLV